MEVGQKFLDAKTKTVYQVVAIDKTAIILETQEGIRQILLKGGKKTTSRSSETPVSQEA
jgi:hypothetical protein